MDYDVYCDESYPDLFSSKKPKAKYLVIGSLWLCKQNRNVFKKEIHSLRDKHKMGRGEFKWKKVSKSRLAFYEELLDWFIAKGDELSFRCIIVDNAKINLVEFHKDDQELGFYKFYYQMLHHWLEDNNSYNIFCDNKTISTKSRLITLRECLRNANKSSWVTDIQAVTSKESVLLQLSDVLVGLASSKFNNNLKQGSLKSELISYFEQTMGREIMPTSKDEKKFNVFKIKLRDGR
ncbi:MAG TPA: DUF3800 domain-containing protein [Candidatus Cloacimonas acidaminovorans]|jgi:hypothetical protein|nr:DUF3800 domain-containing protein [Candidatus Cloacimonas acidaminovorans]